MSKHQTKKSTTYGKAQTIARRAVRQAKRAGSNMDLDRLARDIGAVVV